MVPGDREQNNAESMSETGMKPGGGHALLLFLKHIQTLKSSAELCAAVSGLICKVLHVTGGGVMIMDRKNGEFYTPAASMMDVESEKLFVGSRYCSGRSPFEVLFSTGDVSVVDFRGELPAPFRDMDPQMRSLIRIRLDVPLRCMDTIAGTLWAINPTSGIFDADTALLMGALAGITGSALANFGPVAHPGLSSDRIKDFNQAGNRVIDHLSHAIKTPLAVSIASLKLLEKQLHRLPETAWKRTYDRTERNLKRLLNIEYEMEDILRNHQQAIENLNPASETCDPI